MPEIKVFVDGAAPTIYRLTNELVTLGRGDNNSIVLPDRTASSAHAQIVESSDGWQIDDLKSTNGTLVNGQPVESVVLRDGDRIQIGKIEIVYADDTVPNEPVGSDYLQSLCFYPESDDAGLPSLIIDEVHNNSEQIDMSFVGFQSGAISSEPFPQHEKGPSTKTVEVESSDLDNAKDKKVLNVRGEHVAETKLRLVQQVSEQLVRIFEPQQLLDEIMTIVVDQTGADRGLLCLLDDQRQPIPIAARGIRANEEIRVSRTVLGRLLNEGTGVLINSLDEEPNAIQSLVEMKVQSTMCAPLWTGDRIVGILSIDSMTIGKTFSQQDLELLLAVAHPVAVGIERNRLSHEVDTERNLRDYLSKYLDHRIVEQISQGQGTGDDPLAPSEVEVTILFSDIVSFTKMSESLSAVELADFMRRYLTVMTDVVFAYGGTIDKYIGDSVMALFGAPVPSEDSAAAAIRAALAMQHRIKEFDLPGSNGKPLSIRIGINTGPVVVGNLGSERRSEYTALGDAVNVASRLETFARPNEICIDDHTYEKTKDFFDVEEIGTIDVKNRAAPVVVYRVMGERKI